jgi:hypothetical protein
MLAVIGDRTDMAEIFRGACIADDLRNAGFRQGDKVSFNRASWGDAIMQRGNKQSSGLRTKRKARKAFPRGDSASGSERITATLQQLPSEQIYLRLLRKSETAALCGLTVRGLEELMARRVIPFIRVSRRCVRFQWGAVEKALRKLEIKEIGR